MVPCAEQKRAVPERGNRSEGVWMFGIGMPEFILLMAIALIVIGPKKLPDLARALGRALGEFKKATADLKDSLEIDAPLSDVERSFKDLNKNLTKDLYKKTLEEAAPKTRVPPESGADEPGNEGNGEKRQFAKVQAAPRETEKGNPSETETLSGELPKDEVPGGNVPDRESSAAAHKPLSKAEQDDKKDEARKA